MGTSRRLLTHLLALTGVLLMLPAAPVGAVSHLGPQRALTVPAVYGYAQQSLTRSGMLYHAIIRDQTVAGPYRYTTTTDQWVDAHRNLVREQVDLTYGLADSRGGYSLIRRASVITIITRNLEYSHSPRSSVVETVKPQLCYVPELLAAEIVLGCSGSGKMPMSRVWWGQARGRRVVILAGSGAIFGQDRSTTATSRLELDPATYLPMARVTVGTVELGKRYPLRGTTAYTHRFVPASTVAADFFDPASLHYSDRGT